MRTDRERLQDILAAIEQIEEYTVMGQKVFDENQLIQSAVLYQIVIIGESVRALSHPLQLQYSQIPWSLIVGMRNNLVHEYFNIDLEIVWRVVKQNLPELKEKIEAISKIL